VFDSIGLMTQVIIRQDSALVQALCALTRATNGASDAATELA
jgi:hypothetical protein